MSKRRYDGVLRDAYGSPIEYPPSVGAAWVWLVIYTAVVIFIGIKEGVFFSLLIGLIVLPWFVSMFKEAYRYR